MPMTTGSDTRMYSPRSESMLGYTKDDDDYKYGVGDPKEMDKLRDEKQAKKEAEEKVDDLPHLKISIPKPAPEMPPMMPEEEEEPMMDDQFNEGQQFGAMTGMPDMGNLSLGAATGTMPAPGGMLATGEPMDDAWSSLLKEDLQLRNSAELAELARQGDIEAYNEMMKRTDDYYSANEIAGEPDVEANLEAYGAETGKNPFKNPPVGLTNQIQIHQSPVTPIHADKKLHNWQYKNASEPMEDAWSTLMKSRLDDMGGSEDKSWKQPQYKIQPGGADISTATSRRSKLHSRFLKPSKKRGLDKAPLAVHRSHLGIETKQPLRLFPRGYDQQMGTMQRRKLMGNVPVMPAGHALGRESVYNPKSPSMAGSAGLPIKEPGMPRLRGQALAKSDIEILKSELEEVKKKHNYMQFAQIRRLLRQLKDAAERQERRLKAAKQGGHGNNREAGHREGQDSTTRPEGATEDMENDPKNWGAPSTMFAARGSGRVG